MNPIRQIVIETIDRETAFVLSQKTPAERLQIASGMWRSARNMLQHLLTSEHPHWTEEEIKREVAARLSHGAS